MGLALAVALGTWLRLAVTWTDPQGTFLNDAAFHQRMVEEVVAHGRVPDPDRASEPPAGRDVGAYLPTGMYHAASAFHAIARATGTGDLRTHLLWFVALAGGLIALPVYFGTRALSGGVWPALAAALFAATSPAHVHRTYAYWLRYDALGTLLLLAHVAFALRALAGGRRVWLESALSAVFLLLALACWRVALVVPAFELFFVFIWVGLRGASRPLWTWVASTAAAVLLAGVAFEYLRAQRFFVSPTVLALAIVTVGVWGLARYSKLPARARWQVLVGGLTLGLVIGRVLSANADQLGLVPARFFALLGREGATSPLVRLQLSVEELRPASLLDLVGPGFLSWSGIWLLAAPILAWLAAGRRITRDGVALLVALTTGFVIATFLFERNKVLLGPVAAIALGAFLGSWMSKRSAGRWAVAIALLVSMAVTAYEATMVAFSRRPDRESDYTATLAYLRERTPADAVVLAPWELGYEIQTVARRPAVMDGLLESRENGSRIQSFARASFESAPDSMLAMAKRYGAAYLVVPPSAHLYGLGWMAGVPFAHKLVRGIPLEPEESQGVMTQMMVVGRTYAGLEKVFEQGGYRVYFMHGPGPR